jgi:hypothetical protein
LTIHLTRGFHHDETPSSHHTVVHHIEQGDNYVTPHEDLSYACCAFANNHRPNHHHHVITNQPPKSPLPVEDEEEQAILIEAFNTSVRLNKSPETTTVPTKVPTKTPTTLETLHNR